MVENGYISREDGETAKKEPLGVNPRVVSPNSIASGYFAEEVRREIGERYGEKTLYEGGLSVRATLDPKMQAMARKALVDGLVRFDEARGWRGAHQKHRARRGANGDWRSPRCRRSATSSPGGSPSCSSTTGGQAQDRPAAEARGVRPGAYATARPARSRPDGVKWTRRTGRRRAVSAGDVVYVEPLEGRPGQFRLRQVPEISGAIVAMDPYTGRVHAMVGGFSYDQSEFNRATPGAAPAGLVVQAVRLRDRARQRLHAFERHPRRADHDRHGARPGGLDAVELRRQVGGPAHAALRHRAFEEPDDRASRQGRRHAAHRRICRAASASTTTCCRCCRCRSAPARRPSCA